MADTIKNESGEDILLDEPVGIELPSAGFLDDEVGYDAPADDGSSLEVIVDPNSDRFTVRSF